MSLYGIGDLAIIVSEEEIRLFRDLHDGWASPEGLYIFPEMLRSCSKTFEIEEVRNDKKEWYHLAGSPWIWSSSCFDGAKDVFEGMESLL